MSATPELLAALPASGQFAAHGPQRSRSPRQRRGDTRRLCVNGCGRAAAAGYAACCRTCNMSGGASHGPRCNATWRQVNEPPSPVQEPTTSDAPAVPSTAASRDAPMRDHVFCAYCHQRRGNQQCTRCNLQPLCKNCLPMHWCNQRPQEETSAA